MVVGPEWTMKYITDSNNTFSSVIDVAVCISVVPSHNEAVHEYVLYLYPFISSFMFVNVEFVGSSLQISNKNYVIGLYFIILNPFNAIMRIYILKA